MSEDRYEKWETNNIYQWFEETIKSCLQDEVICLIRMIRDKKEEKIKRKKIQQEMQKLVESDFDNFFYGILPSVLENEKDKS
jgi:hypothetical protein